MRRLFGLLWAAFWSLPVLGAWWWWYAEYRPREDCFNEQGRCFDPETGLVYHDQTIVGLTVVAFPCAVLALIGIILVVWPRSAKRAKARATTASPSPPASTPRSAPPPAGPG